MPQISGKIIVHLSFNVCIGLGVGNNGSKIFISGSFEFFFVCFGLGVGNNGFFLIHFYLYLI